MNHYRLLRDNKESGPYSQDDLILKGFKAYDLIWVEGKSAGWRYPSEIEELKKFAPVVEEQPYDRFYKKPAPQRNLVTEEKSSRVSYSNIKKEEEAPAKIQTSREPAYTIQPAAGRHIHVTLPSGNTVNVTTINTNSKKETVEEKPKYSPVPAEEKKPVFAEAIAQTYKQPVAAMATTLFAEPEKRTSAPVIYPQAAYNNRAGFSWTMILGLFVGVATLVGLGVMIGLSISRTKSETVLNKPVAQKAKEPMVSVPTTTEDKAVGIDQNANQPLATDSKELVRNAVIKTADPATSTVKEDKPQTGLTAKPENATGNPQTEAALPKKPAAAVSIVDIEKQVNISNNGYKIGAFGGISDLQCTLVNDSKFALDAVEVEVQYIQANDKVYKTEKLSFKDIAPGTQVTLNAPRSPRGVKVVSRIIKINSKESGLSNTTVKS